jgi:hypothetical protein
MIMVVMVGMSVAFSYVVVYSDTYKAGIGSSVLESLTIEDVWIQSGTTVNITVYNSATGTNLGTDSGMTITVATIYVNGTALLNPVSNNIEFKNYVISPGNHVTIMANIQSVFNVRDTYVFKIVTTRGSNFVSPPTKY